MESIRLYLGTACGKSTATFGLLMRALSKGKNVTLVFFDKREENSSEGKAMQLLASHGGENDFGKLNIHYTGVNRIGTGPGGSFRLYSAPNGILPEDKTAAQEGLDYIAEALKRGDDIVIGDELLDVAGKRVFVFGDATHAVAAARVASSELGLQVVGLGTYSREFAREVREAARGHGIEALITDDYLEVEAAVAAAEPELVLGTQMERHIAKRLGVPCAVISAPVHVQDFPARYAPQMGFEGANVLFDTLVHPLMMGLEEHLLGMFREDFEFHAQAAPSHLGTAVAAAPVPDPDTSAAPGWTQAAERELGKVPFFVRGRARRNTERYAEARGLAEITVETLYDAKAHFGRTR